MTHALVLIEKPEDVRHWSNELSALEHSAAPLPGATRLPGHSWLIDLDTGLSVLGTLLGALAKTQHISYKVAFLEQAPKFVANP